MVLGVSGVDAALSRRDASVAAWGLSDSRESNLGERRLGLEGLLEAAVLSADWTRLEDVAIAFQRSDLVRGSEINRLIAGTLLRNLGGFLNVELRQLQQSWGSSVAALTGQLTALGESVKFDDRRKELQDGLRRLGSRPTEVRETTFLGLLRRPVSVETLRRNLANETLDTAAAFLAESFIGEALEGNGTCAILCEPLKAEAALARFMLEQDEHLAEQIATGKAGSFHTAGDLTFWGVDSTANLQTSESTRVPVDEPPVLALASAPPKSNQPGASATFADLIGTSVFTASSSNQLTS